MPRKNRKNSKTFIVVLYLLVGVSCLLWLAVYTLYFRQEQTPPGAGVPAAGPATSSTIDVPAKTQVTAATASQEAPPGAAAPEVSYAKPGNKTGNKAPPLQPNGAASRQSGGHKNIPVSGQPEAGRASTLETAFPARPVRGRIAIILDDAGYQNTLLKSFLEFPGKLTVSILPGLPGSAAALELIRKHNKQFMLHLPMEPTAKENPGPGALMTSMSDAEILGLVRRHIDSLPGIAGVNNHMGSRATEDPRLMRLVLETLKEHRLYFIDSRTTAHSQAPAAARGLGLAILERSVFLDNEQNINSIKNYFETGKKIALRQGWAIMIGHVWCGELAEILPELYQAAKAEGYEFVFVSELFAGGGG